MTMQTMQLPSPEISHSETFADLSVRPGASQVSAVYYQLNCILDAIWFRAYVGSKMLLVECVYSQPSSYHNDFLLITDAINYSSTLPGPIIMAGDSNDPRIWCPPLLLQVICSLSLLALSKKDEYSR